MRIEHLSRPTAMSLCAALLLSSSAFAQQVWRVAADGSGDSTTIDAILPLAQDGDTILVNYGNYPGFQIFGRSLNIVARDGITPLIEGVVEVRNLAPSQVISFSGFRFEGKKAAVGVPSGPLDGHGIVAAANAGTLVLHACEILGADGDSAGSGSYSAPGVHPAGWPALVIQGSSNVTVEQCTIRGGRAAFVQNLDCGCHASSSGGHGILALNCNISLHDATVVGGASNVGDYAGGNGGNGVTLLSGQLFASGTAFSGGNGGAAMDFMTGTSPGNGGNGLLAGSTSAEATLFACTASGGNPGIALFGQVGAPGLPWGGSGPIVAIAGVARSLDIPAAPIAGTVTSITQAGVVGDHALLMAAAQPGYLDVIELANGVILLDLIQPLTVVDLGTLPASGVLTVPASLASLPVGIDSVTYYLQSISVTPSLGLHLSGLTPVTILRPGL